MASEVRLVWTLPELSAFEDDGCGPEPFFFILLISVTLFDAFVGRIDPSASKEAISTRMSISSDAASKEELRAAALARRDALSVEQRAAAAVAIAARMPPLVTTSSTVIAGYAPIRNEIDPAPLMQKFAARGAVLAMPAISRPDAALVFRMWKPGEALVRGALGTYEPPADIAEVVPDIVLVPLAAFDPAGHRIGYGAGYYDRTLEALRQHKAIVAIGLAFSVQEIPRVPALSHDVRLDYVLTEASVFGFGSE
ncbi:5-formyltetrahydrofolate cyclo-ligase [Nitrobacter sp. Nb-311A]|nr:5-formyltetrahydrofolate cyclo-ligase [Nitrobacter sp. Nb-311A]